MSLPLRQVEHVSGKLFRPDASHVIFDFDGTISWLRHGWPKIMLRTFLDYAPATWMTDERQQSQLLSEILSLNGKPSIYQAERFCERASAIGQRVPEPSALLAQYLDVLRTTVDERINAVRDDIQPRDAFIVWNGRTILDLFYSRGLTLIILSGTAETDVRMEADLLCLSELFGQHIYGSPANGQFSKKQVIDRIMRDEHIEGRHLLAFGDGPVEIRFTKAVGGLAIGVASDEEQNGSHRMDLAKKEQLIAAGADAVIPDYAEAEGLVAAILGR
jgi:phosphoglycolate phosphatase-like HAD superfamily hydrolase